MNFEDTIKIYTLFQTTFRNIGLFTSIGLAILAGSRFFRDKIEFIKNEIFLLALSFIFIFLSILINSFLIFDLENYYKKKINKIIKKWIYLCYIVLFFNLLLLFYIFFVMSFYISKI